MKRLCIAVIGSEGIVGRTLVQFFTDLGHNVLAVDRQSELTLETAVSQAQVAIIVTLPIEEVGGLIKRAAAVMQPGTLLVHGTSIEEPKEPGSIETRLAIERGLAVAHCHFHFRPAVPLQETLKGQSITISLSGHGAEDWQQWFSDLFEPYQPIIHWLEQGEHDQLTSISQLVHMIAAFLISSVWLQRDRSTVQRGIAIGGPPCNLLVRSILRTALGNRVVASILLNHREATGMIDQMIGILTDLKTIIVARQESEIEARLAGSRQILTAEQRTEIDESTNRLLGQLTLPPP